MENFDTGGIPYGHYELKDEFVQQQLAVLRWVL